MTDTQTLSGAILGAAGVISGALKWATSKLTKSQDRFIEALVKSAESNVILAAKLDVLTTRFEDHTSRFDRLVEVLLSTGGVGAGLSAVARLGRAPTSPMLPTISPTPEGASDGGADESG